MKQTTIHNCDIIRDLLPGYMERLLSDAGEEAVKEHLSHCKDCEKIYSQMKEDIFHEEPSPEENRALDGFRKLFRRTRHLKLLLISACTLILCGILSGFLGLFVIGSPVGTSWIDHISCIYDEETDSLNIQGHAQNVNISKVIWEKDSENETLINVLVYETEALPFTSETHDFTLTIPDAKGMDVCLACPKYDRSSIYSWKKDHYELVQHMEEAIFQTAPSLDPDTAPLSCASGISLYNGQEGLIFHLDYVIGEGTVFWVWNDSIITDGDLEPADFEIWVSLKEPHEVHFFDYQTGTWTDDASIVEERRPSTGGTAQPVVEQLSR